MLPILATFVYVLAVASSAPAPGAQPLLAQQYVILQHPAAAQHQQLHYEPVYKLQQPLFQQITPVGSLETPQKQQLIVLYPNGPLTQFPLISLRQTEPTNWETAFAFFQNLVAGAGGAGQQPEAPPPTEEKEKLFMIEKDAEQIPKDGIAPALVPASTIPLDTPDRRFFILSGQPQFFGKYNVQHTPLTPFLTPVQAIHARASVGAIQAEPAIAAEPLTHILPQELNQLPAALPLQAGAALPLRSTFAAPLQPLQPLDQPLQPFQSDSFRNEPLPDANDIPQEQARSFEPSHPEDDETPQPVARSQSGTDENAFAFEPKDASAAAPGAPMMSEEPSIAQAKPSGIALAGRGGVASSKPLATALVGDGGLALSAPSATAISGDFSDEDDVENKKNFNQM